MTATHHAGSDLRRAAGQVLVAGFPGAALPDNIRAALAADRLGGVILFRRNIETPEQVRALNNAVIEAASLPHMIAVDQEGGRVARLGAPVIKLPPMRRVGELGDVDLTERLGHALGAQLHALGFNMNFAPVLDVDTNPDNPVIGDRSFSREPDEVGSHGSAFARGLSRGGVLSCGKHFPGHGDTDLDSHLALPKLSHDRARLDRIELAPFRIAGPHLDSIMTAHVLFDALDKVPATLSRSVITGLLRDELGFKGVIVSDDLEMKAVSERYGIVDSAIRAIEAGCDVLLVCSRVEACFEAYDALVERAERDPGFANRLLDAARRARAMCERRPATRADYDAKQIDALASPDDLKRLQ